MESDIIVFRFYNLFPSLCPLNELAESFRKIKGIFDVNVIQTNHDDDDDDMNYTIECSLALILSPGISGVFDVLGQCQDKFVNLFPSFRFGSIGTYYEENKDIISIDCRLEESYLRESVS